MEGIAAIGVVFILFTVLAQAATALIAHRVAGGAVAASSVRVAIDPSSVNDEVLRLEREMAAVVPGSGAVVVEIDVAPPIVGVTARFDFTPPGPVLRSFQMEVSASAALVAEP